MDKMMTALHAFMARHDIDPDGVSVQLVFKDKFDRCKADMGIRHDWNRDTLGFPDIAAASFRYKMMGVPVELTLKNGE